MVTILGNPAENSIYYMCIIPAQVTVLGTPAENSCGGSKIDMIQRGAFDDVDFAMMLSALNNNIAAPKHYLLVTGLSNFN